MKIKIKLSIMMIAIVAVIAGGIAVIELSRATDIAMNLAKQKAMYLARQRAQFWDGKIDGYIKVLETVSNVMNFYENLKPEIRRQEYENTIASVKIHYIRNRF